MSRILLVSKPVAPPWNDSSKNLVRDLALGMARHEPVVMGRRGCAVELGRAVVEPLYPQSAGGFAPALADNARVLVRLLAGRREPLWHFFFAPNARTSAVARGAARLRRTATVQTVCSEPRTDADPLALLFADATVVLSRRTEQRLAGAGVPGGRLHRIPPAVPPLDVPSRAEQRRARVSFAVPEDVPLIVYPGDLELGGGARVAVDALAAMRRADARLVLACRRKTRAADDAERRLRERLHASGLDGRVGFAGETARIHALLGAADVVILPSASLWAKMDLPLVLLEAMSMERPVVVARGTAAEELAEGGAAVAVEPRSEPLAAELDRLLDDADTRSALGRAARAHVLGHHAPSEMARAYETLYDALL